MDERISRRAALRGLGATGALGLAGCLGGGDDGNGSSGSGTDGGSNGNGGANGSGSGTTTTGGGGGGSGPVTIGVLEPLSGDLQYYGQLALWGDPLGVRVQRR